VNSLELESKAVKAGYGSVNHFLISKSFTLSLPAIFGNEKEGGAGDARILPKFKTFESFNPQLSFTGGLIEIKAKVKLEVESSRPHQSQFDRSSKIGSQGVCYGCGQIHRRNSRMDECHLSHAVQGRWEQVPIGKLELSVPCSLWYLRPSAVS
jgi:hypothetical protein